MQVCNLRPCPGFTLIELVTVIAVLIITLGFAVPGFSGLIASNQQTSLINQFATSLAHARFYAVENSRRVVLCPSHDLESCSGGFDWQQGFISFVDENYNRLRDGQEKLLAVAQINRNEVQVQTSTGRRKIVFYPSGSSPGSNVTIRFCSKVSNIPGKALILSNSGRARLSKTTASGDEITCS
jgi:type IV fimbrial biogenesis protein FimT